MVQCVKFQMKTKSVGAFCHSELRGRWSGELYGEMGCFWLGDGFQHGLLVFFFFSQQRHGDESNLREEGLIILANSLRVQPIMAGKEW